MNDNLFTRLARPAGAAGKPFMVSPNGAVRTYADLDRASARVANALIAQGLVPGDRVVAQVDKSAEAIILYLATLRAGGVYLPLNTAYTLAELQYFLSDSQPRILVCAPAMHAGLEALAATLGVQSVLTLSADGGGSLPALAAAQSTTFEDVPRSPQDLAAILYTSGTTGRSKGAMLTHGNLCSNALVLREYWHYSAHDCLLHALPIFHIHGLFVAVNITLAAGASMRLLPRFDPNLVLAQLPNCSVMMGVPTFYVRLLDDTRLTRAATAHMRLFVSGSAPLLDATHRAWQERTGHALLERYGMTETGMNTSNPYDGERIPGTVGLPLPGIALRVVDHDSGAELPRGSTGMIEVRGPNVFAGYWRNAEKTRAEFRDDGYFITGDLGQIDARGYVRIVGRGKDLIISGGFNVYPKEVETELDALPGVLESAVIGLPHTDFGEAVTAAVIARDRAPECNEATMIASLKQRLAAYKCPKRVLFVDELPRNTMGKVQKNLLRQQYAHLYSSHSEDSQ
jgi:malonyl-CoA/methylmalonyl-CoA synthetase